jgi:hypothetical protein
MEPMRAASRDSSWPHAPADDSLLRHLIARSRQGCENGTEIRCLAEGKAPSALRHNIHHPSSSNGQQCKTEIRNSQPQITQSLSSRAQGKPATRVLSPPGGAAMEKEPSTSAMFAPPPRTYLCLLRLSSCPSTLIRTACSAPPPAADESPPDIQLCSLRRHFQTLQNSGRRCEIVILLN